LVVLRSVGVYVLHTTVTRELSRDDNVRFADFSKTAIAPVCFLLIKNYFNKNLHNISLSHYQNQLLMVKY
jgi:hypothetical protein